jgi:dihydropyrimidinase
MERFIIKNGTIVTNLYALPGDILIENGAIAALGNLGGEKADQIFDASGCFVMPGGIDPHVHLSLDSGGGVCTADDFENGTRAALAGGTTSVIDFVTPAPGEKLMDALKKRRAEADGNVLCDYGLHMSVTEWRDSIPAEMAEGVAAGAPSCKTYLAYKKAIGIEDWIYVRVLGAAAEMGCVILTHCEHGDTIDFLREKFIREGKTSPYWHPRSRPAAVEEEAIKRAIALAGTVGSPLYIVHLSTKGGLAAVREARAQGLAVFAETCPHYLLLDESRYDGTFAETAKYTMSPPLRPLEHVHALGKGIEDGGFDVVATDHCPFSTKGQKDRGKDDFTKIPNGAPGIEERMKLLWHFGVHTRRITPMQFVSLTSTRAAEIFGMAHKKGTLNIGADADILVWDPRLITKLGAHQQVSKCDESIWEGMEVAGAPRFVFARGRLACEGGKVIAGKGNGQYIERFLP